MENFQLQTAAVWNVATTYWTTKTTTS